MTSGEQQRKLRETAGSCRFVYNKALGLQAARRAENLSNLTYAALCKELTTWRRSPLTAWLADAPVHALQQAPVSGGAVGIDLGITRFATFSDGTHVEPLNSFRTHENRLQRAQRAMSRKQKFSKNWEKDRTRINRIHTRIANARRDFLHKITSTICKNHAMVCIEDLDVRGMSKAATSKRRITLNKGILDQGWSEFRRQLTYKLAHSGGLLVAVPPQHTSMTCPKCGLVDPGNRPSQARFRCVACQFAENANLVGAMNILARGHRVAACGEPVQLGRSAKQEPTEVS